MPCSDSNKNYDTLAKSLNINHKKSNASEGQRTAEKIYIIQNVNNIDTKLRKFLASFNKLATKYLQNYLN